MTTKHALPFSRLFKALAKRAPVVAQAPMAPPVGREIAIAKIIARLRQRSPQHAQRLQEMLRQRGIHNSAKELEREGFQVAPGMDARKKLAMEKVAKFMISKGPATAEEYLEGFRKLLAAKALEKAPTEVAKASKKPSAVAKLIRKKKSKKPKPLYGTPTGRGTAAFRFGD